jgi:hypothetical protein
VTRLKTIPNAAISARTTTTSTAVTSRPSPDDAASELVELEEAAAAWSTIPKLGVVNSPALVTWSAEKRFLPGPKTTAAYQREVPAA